MLKESNMDEIKGDRMKKLILAGFLVAGAMANDDDKLAESLLFGLGYKVFECMGQKLLQLPKSLDVETYYKLSDVFERDCRKEHMDNLTPDDQATLSAYISKRGRESANKVYNAGGEAVVKQYEGKK